MTTGIGFKYSDGGRAASGRSAGGDDCVVRAATLLRGFTDGLDPADCGTAEWGRLYGRMFRRLSAANGTIFGRGLSADGGIYRTDYEPVFVNDFGFMKVGLRGRRGLTIAEAYRRFGDCIVRVRNHLVAVIDGNVYDLFGVRKSSLKKKVRSVFVIPPAGKVPVAAGMIGRKETMKDKVRKAAVVAAVAMVAVAVPVAVVAAAGGLSDVAGHPQESAIRSAVAAGWFKGHEDGTFRPDETLTDGQALKVFRRRFPQGMTRAELAAVMVAGDEALTRPAAVSGSGPVSDIGATTTTSPADVSTSTTTSTPPTTTTSTTTTSTTTTTMRPVAGPDSPRVLDDDGTWQLTIDNIRIWTEPDTWPHNAGVGDRYRVYIRWDTSSSGTAPTFLFKEWHPDAPFNYFYSGPPYRFQHRVDYALLIDGRWEHDTEFSHPSYPGEYDWVESDRPAQAIAAVIRAVPSVHDGIEKGFFPPRWWAMGTAVPVCSRIPAGGNIVNAPPHPGRNIGNVCNSVLGVR